MITRVTNDCLLCLNGNLLTEFSDKNTEAVKKLLYIYSKSGSLAEVRHNKEFVAFVENKNINVFPWLEEVADFANETHFGYLYLNADRFHTQLVYNGSEISFGDGQSLLITGNFTSNRELMTLKAKLQDSDQLFNDKNKDIKHQLDELIFLEFENHCTENNTVVFMKCADSIKV